MEQGRGQWDGGRFKGGYPSSPVPQVHTDVSDGYDRQESTQVVAELPEGTTPTPTQRQGRKEDAMTRRAKRGKGRLPYGKGRTTLVEIIASHAHPHQEFNATALYNWMNNEVQAAWRTAYGTRGKTISRIASFLADINTRTDFPMDKLDTAPSTYTYNGGWKKGRVLQNTTPTTTTVSKTVKTRAISVNLSKTVKPIKTLDNYTNVGFTLTNEPLFQHRDTGVVGTLVFAPLG